MDRADDIVAPAPPDDTPASPSADAWTEPDELAHQRRVDIAIGVGFVLVMLLLVLILWLTVGTGGGCAPAHQALGHC